jgi:hypothetical protein
MPPIMSLQECYLSMEMTVSWGLSPTFPRSTECNYEIYDWPPTTKLLNKRQTRWSFKIPDRPGKLGAKLGQDSRREGVGRSADLGGLPKGLAGAGKDILGLYGKAPRGYAGEHWKIAGARRESSYSDNSLDLATLCPRGRKIKQPHCSSSSATIAAKWNSSQSIM